MHLFNDLNDFSNDEIGNLLELANQLDNYPEPDILKGKVLALLFFNSSLRTLTSFQAAMSRLGGGTFVVSPDMSIHGLETQTGIVMDGNAAEHINEAIPVIESYADVIGIRAFAQRRNLKEDLEDFSFKNLINLTSKPFINMESALKITNSDYKSVRRNLFSFSSLSANSKKQLVTRLLLAARAKLRNSDIIQYLEELSAERDLEVYKINDPEPTVSIPDIAVTSQDMAGYLRLVGSKNLMLTKKFLELAKDGKSVPANILQAYIPAIIILDNIAKAGAGYVQALRALENRAKNSRK